jgi:hypothetical protein
MNVPDDYNNYTTRCHVCGDRVNAIDNPWCSCDEKAEIRCGLFYDAVFRDKGMIPMNSGSGEAFMERNGYVKVRENENAEGNMVQLWRRKR